MTIERLYRDTFFRSKISQITDMHCLVTSNKYPAYVGVVFLSKTAKDLEAHYTANIKSGA